MIIRGFTLIELLAVIVILAIIAVIATPIITGIIETSKKSSFERSAEGVVEAFTYEDSGVVVESFEVGDNCVSFFQTNHHMSEEEVTTFCSGGELNGVTLKEALNKGYLNLEELKTNNVIKNVVITGAITITDYDINKGGVDIVIPSIIDGKTVVAIGIGAFVGKKLSTETSTITYGNIKSVVIPSTIKSIGRLAFENNQLTSVTIESADTIIVCGSFEYNDNLTSVNIAGVDTAIDNMPCYAYVVENIFLFNRLRYNIGVFL